MLRTLPIVSSLFGAALLLAHLVQSAPLRCDSTACVTLLSGNYFDIACKPGRCFGCRWAEGGLDSSSEDDFVVCHAVPASPTLAEETSTSQSNNANIAYEPMDALEAVSEESQIEGAEQLQSEELDKRIKELVEQLSHPLQAIDISAPDSQADWSSSSSSSSSDSQDMPEWLQELFISVEDPELQRALVEEVQDLFNDSKMRERSKA